MRGADHQTWAVDVPTGFVVGAWVVTRPVATGSWGSVYAARRKPAVSGQPMEAALKFLPAGSLTPLAVADFRATRDRENAARSALRDRYIIETHELLTVDDAAHPELAGATVLVMELADESLQHRLDAHPGRALAEAPVLLRELALALRAVHRAGWIHADVKPGNILLTKNGVRLTDFGLATQLEEGTHAYLPPIGSNDYLPPEELSEPLTVRGRAVRGSRDVWAFGVVAYQLLTGRRPFPGDSARSRTESASRFAAGRRELLDLDRVPETWRALVGDCLHPDPRRRPTMDHVVAQIDGLRPVRRPLFRPWVAILAAAVVLSVVIGAAVLLLDRPAGPSQATPVAPATPTPTPQPPEWSRVFYDDFSGTKINRSKWDRYESTSQHWALKQDSVSKGLLRIRLDVNHTKPDDWLAGGLSSKGSANRTSGRYLARLRVTRSSCLRFAVLLFPSTGVTSTWLRLYSEDHLQGAVTRGVYDNGDWIERSDSRLDLTSWHTFGIEWSAGEVVWTLDGRPWGAPTTQRIPRGKHEFVTQVQRSSGTGPSCQSAELQIDSVEVDARAT